jgi:hypothetical protein
MLKSVLISAALAAATASILPAQPKSPPAETSVTIAGKTITIKYAAPSVRGRQIFGDGGLVSHDPTYPVWRTGANAATSLHTDGELDFPDLSVPAGDYTLFTLVNTNPWQLIVSKATKEWGLAYKQDQDLGRTKMTMSKPASPVEQFKITLTATGGNKGKLQLEWENVVASATFTVK